MSEAPKESPAILQPQPQREEETLREMAQAHLQSPPGNRLSLLYNEPRSHVICFTQRKPTAQHPFNELQFLVYDIKNQKLIHKNSLRDGQVSWLDDHQVKVERTQMTPGAENNTYLFDVNSQRKHKQ